MIYLSSGQAAACRGLSKYKTPLTLAREIRGEEPRAPSPDPRDVNHPLNRGHLMEAAVIHAGVGLIEKWLIAHCDPGNVQVTPVHLGGKTGRDVELFHPSEPMTCHPDGLYLVHPTNACPRWRVIVCDAKTSNIFDDWDPESGGCPMDVTIQGYHTWEVMRACWESGELRDLVEDMLASADFDAYQDFEPPETIEPIFAVPYALPAREPFRLVMLPIDPEDIRIQVEWEHHFLGTYVRPWERGEECPWPDPADLDDIQALYPDVDPEKEHVATEELVKLLDQLQFWSDAEETWKLPNGQGTTKKEIDGARKGLKTQILAITKRDGFLVDRSGGRILASLKSTPESTYTTVRQAGREVELKVKGLNDAREKARKKGMK